MFRCWAATCRVDAGGSLSLLPSHSQRLFERRKIWVPTGHIVKHSGCPFADPTKPFAKGHSENDASAEGVSFWFQRSFSGGKVTECSF